MTGFKQHIFVCLNERDASHPKGCCTQRGSRDVYAYLKKRVAELGLNREIRVNQSGCLDHCEFGPTVVVYPEAVWYSMRSVDDAREFMDSHVQNKRIVERLLVKKPENDASSA